MVRAEPNRGFYVASFSARDVEEIYDLWATLEAMALELAIPRLDRATLDACLADLDRYDARYAAVRTDEERQVVAEEFLDADRAFHRMLAERAENSRLTSLIEGLWAQIAVFQRAGARRGWTDVSIRHHRVIIAALRDGDPAAANRGDEAAHRRGEADGARRSGARTQWSSAVRITGGGECQLMAWEYQFSPSDDLAKLDALGRDGWELVGTAPGGAGTLLFKRPRLSFREQVTLDQKRRYYALWGVEMTDDGEGKAR